MSTDYPVTRCAHCGSTSDQCYHVIADEIFCDRCRPLVVAQIRQFWGQCGFIKSSWPVGIHIDAFRKRPVSLTGRQIGELVAEGEDSQ